MPGIGSKRLSELRQEFKKVERILATTPTVSKTFGVPTEEFVARQRKTYQALKRAGHEVGFVFSDEHYNGDVPYLGGNTNISIEQVAGVIGKTGFHVAAGLEGGYIADQLAPRAKAIVHKVEMLKLADEEYPVEAELLKDVIDAAAGRKVKSVALLTPRQVIPAALVEHLEELYGRDNVLDVQEIYYRVKYEKSDAEMRLIRDANVVADAMMRTMLAVLRPGLMETQVAAWPSFVAKEMGAEEMGFDVMVGANVANRTLIGKALNRRIKKGDYVHVGVAPKRDGLNSCIRRSVIAVEKPSQVTDEQRYWSSLVEEAYQVGYDEYVRVAKEGRPARLQEQALVDFFAGKSEEVSARGGRPVQLEMQKPYTGTHNGGYTECQEFYGAITLDSHEPLGKQIVTMLDVALRGVGSQWDDVVIPGFDFWVVENTLGKFGTRVRQFNKVPNNVQKLVGTGLD